MRFSEKISLAVPTGKAALARQNVRKKRSFSEQTLSDPQDPPKVTRR
jgi:hypothetical protein